MDTLTVVLLLTSILGITTSVVLGILFYRLNNYQNLFESYLIDLSAIVTDYHSFIENLFKQSIHYYDDTIHDFLEKTKVLRQDLDDFMLKYEDLANYVVPPEPEPEQPKEILGIVRPDILTKGPSIRTTEIDNT